MIRCVCSRMGNSRMENSRFLKVKEETYNKRHVVQKSIKFLKIRSINCYLWYSYLCYQNKKTNVKIFVKNVTTQYKYWIIQEQGRNSKQQTVFKSNHINTTFTANPLNWFSIYHQINRLDFQAFADWLSSSAVTDCIFGEENLTKRITPFAAKPSQHYLMCKIVFKFEIIILFAEIDLKNRNETQ